MSHQNKTTRIMLVSLVAIALIGAVAGLDFFQVFANGQEVCPHGGAWTKVDGLTGKSYTFNAPSGKVIVETCYKAGTEVVYDTINPGETSVTVTSAFQFDLSHASFRLDDIKEEPTEEPTEEPKFSPLTVSGECLGIEDVQTSAAQIQWTVKNENENAISFSWSANNGQSGNGVVPGFGTTSFTTNGDGTSVTVTYVVENSETETTSSVEACSEEPTPTPTEPPKETTPTPDPTETGEPTESEPKVDPKPDLAAGGSAPTLGSLITLLSVTGTVIGLVHYLTKKIKKGEIIN
jgi:hypothetical protein